MARPLKTFTPEEALRWIRTLSIKSKADDFDKNVRVPDGLAPIRNRLWDATYEAQQTIEALYNKHSKAPLDDAPADLQAWIDAHLSPEGWTRLRASERQKAHQIKLNSSEQITKMSTRASSSFSMLAKEVGMTKKDYLSALADWLSFDKEGMRAAKAFAGQAAK